MIVYQIEVLWKESPIEGFCDYRTSKRAALKEALRLIRARKGAVATAKVTVRKLVLSALSPAKLIVVCLGIDTVAPFGQDLGWLELVAEAEDIRVWRPDE